MTLGSKRSRVEKAEKGKNKAAFKKIAHESAVSSKILAHNGFMVIVFGLAMLLLCVIAIEAAFMITGLIIGNSMVTEGDTYSELLITFVTVAMVCGLDLFFVFKLENLLIASVCKRIWHKGPDGEIIKTSKNKIADDNSDSSISENKKNESKSKNK